MVPLSPLRLLEQNATHGEPYEQEPFLSHSLKAGSLGSGCQQGEDPLPSSSELSPRILTWEEKERFS